MFLSFSAVFCCYAVWILMQFSANIIDYLIDNNYSWSICMHFTRSFHRVKEMHVVVVVDDDGTDFFTDISWLIKFRSINIVKMVNFMSIIEIVVCVILLLALFGLARFFSVSNSFKLYENWIWSHHFNRNHGNRWFKYIHYSHPSGFLFYVAIIII